MAESLELQNAIQRMKCWLCKNVLSVPPIMVLSEDGTKMKCGRCENNNDIPSICRNFSTESIAKFLSFPCIYQDCNEMIPWGEVESHEDACEKKTIKCPIYYQKCEGIVQVRNLEEHLKHNHKELIHIGCTYESYGTAGRAIHFLKYNNHLFITTILNDTNESRIYVASLKKIDTCFKYNLYLSSKTCKTYVAYFDQKIYEYNEMDHCLACMHSKCNLSHYPHTRVKDNIPVNNHFNKIDLAVLKPLFGDVSKIRYSIRIFSKKKYQDNNKASDTTVRNPKKDVNIVDEYLKKQLQCPICMEYMTDKIYNCEKGHVLCINCKLQLSECPSCRTSFGESRCFPLESLADEVGFACLFSKNGCEFTGKLKLLSPHEKECVHKQDSSESQ